MWVYMLKEKEEALCTFKKFKRLVENGSEHKLKIFCTDRCGEFDNSQKVELYQVFL